MRTSVRLYLERLFPGILVKEASSAEEALLMVMLQSWDLLILDVVLPTRSGLDILKEVRELCPETPVLVYSAYSQNYMVKRAREYGAAGFVAKGSSVDQLIQAVREFLPPTPAEAGQPAPPSASAQTAVPELSAADLDRLEPSGE